MTVHRLATVSARVLFASRARALCASAVLAAAVAGAPTRVSAQIREAQPGERADAPLKHADVPVKQVVLFSSGVGYFEHFGSVNGDDTAELRFKTDQINDVLKSLVLQDLDKGQVGTVTYPSQEPLNKTLKSFQVDITANPPLSDLLNELRGAKITVTVAEGTVNGTIVGVEKRRRVVGAADKAEVVDNWLLNLKVGHKFRSLPLDDVRDFQLDDPKLEDELDKALAALAQARDQDKKPVTINFRGKGERRVRIGYVVETPVWKTSYRLILSDNAAANHAGPRTQPAPTTRPGKLPGEASLQGWAIVENQTDNDWNDVQLSLVSGRPISFIQDLYHPLFVPRPVVMPDLYMSLRPQTYQGGVSDEDQDKMNQQRNAINGRFGANAQGGGGGGGGGGSSAGLFGGAGGTNDRANQAQQQIQQPIDPTASVISAASAGQLGELFEYTVGNVTLPRQKSAMIPIVTDDIEIEKLSIYNRNVLETHPLNGARIKNTTHKHLLQGPVTVLEAGSYAGDARIDDLPPGQQRLLSYGIDLNVVVDPSQQSSVNTIETGEIIKGVLTLTRKQVDSQTYVLQNKGDTAKTIIIEHPREANWKLMEPATAEETVENLYRFKTHVDAHKTENFAVKTETVTVQEVQVLSTDVGPLEEFIKTGEIPGTVRKALVQVVQSKNALIDTQRQIDARKAEIADVTQEQTRIRDNMKTVASNSDYYNRLLKKLDEQETSIEKLQKENGELQKTLEKQRTELDASINGLNVQ
jgi:hypothetical protein